MKKTLATFAVAGMVAVMAGCGSTKTDSSTDSGSVGSSSTKTSVEISQADTQEPAAGFEEVPIFEDEEVAFLNVSAVYFQPVPMAPGNENIENYNMHLECDVSALENDLGYGTGDWVPYLTVDYEVIDSKDNKTAASGTFMVMSASDGPHYGANINLPDAGTYTVKFTFHSPAENGYLIHSDSETGPGGLLEDYFGNGNLTVTYEGWDYVPGEW